MKISHLLPSRLLSLSLTLALLTPLSTASVGGPINRTLQDGDWNQASTWTLGIPVAGQQPYLDHAVTVTSPVVTFGSNGIGGGLMPGTLTMTGGTFSGGTLFVGLDSEGTINLEGGQFSAASTLNVGWTHSGVVKISGGTHSFRSIHIGEFINGTVQDGTLVIEGGGASVNLTGGLKFDNGGVVAIRPTANGAAGLSCIHLNNLNYQGGGYELDTSLYTPALGDSWEVVDYAGGINGGGATVAAPFGFTIVEDQSTPGIIRITVTGVPDPSALCNGDGGNQLGCTDCPCMNNASPGTIGGCLNSAGSSARLEVRGDPSVSLPSGDATDLRFSISGAPATAFCILNSGDALAPSNAVNPCFGLDSGAQSAVFDGLRCAIVNTRRHGGRAADASGDVGMTNAPWGGEGGPAVGIANAGPGFVAGQTRYFQVINRDDALLSCMRGLNTSQAVEVTFTP